MANNIKHFRKQAGLEISDLKRLTGLSITAIWRIENNKTKEGNIKWSTIKRLSTALNKKIDEVFF